MNTRFVPASVILMSLLLAGIAAQADDKVIVSSGLSPFVHNGRTFVSVRDVSPFLGVQTRWDKPKRQVVLQRREQVLVLTPSSRSALIDGRNVQLAAAPVIVNGQVFVPVTALQQFSGLQVRPSGVRDRLSILGQDGWGTIVVKRPPWHGGPPPWAPAWGRRGHKGDFKIKIDDRRRGKDRSDDERRFDDDRRDKGKGKSQVKIKIDDRGRRKSEVKIKVDDRQKGKGRSGGRR